ncbi:MAG TPA: hypothetical protein VLD57_09390 [Blastocatellia bacterium]|nr:hypothetical protein [Blastocatellia bacterium]
MDSSEKEIVRKSLLAALSRLEGDDESPQGKGAETGGEFVLVLLGNAGVPSRTLSEGKRAVSSAGLATVPELERFSISQQCSSNSAPKPCFIEPDRVCVNSGACERRGF